MIGRSIGNYKIVRVLGEGGMGTVYLAEHPMIGKRVAVKMLRPDLSTDPGLVSRFFQEAKAVNEIRHPNIVDISDFGHTEDGTVYLVMELMEGRSLRDQLASSGPMPLDLAVLVAKQVVDALAAAHRMGIVHRDLKPDNIFLVTDTQATGGVRSKLFDFGVAKLLGEHHNQVGHKTIDGAVVGTPFYMSPEQALCHDVGAPADIYAMGVVMFEMVTGNVPFRAEQLVILLNSILKQTPPPPSRIRADIPPWMDRLILRCLEKDPEARPRGMEEVSALLVAGGAELQSSASIGLGATMVGGHDAPARSAPAVPTQIRGTASRSPTLAGAIPSASIPASASGELARANLAKQGGVARPAPPPSDLDQAKHWLEQKRVKRLVLPILLIAVVGLVAAIFLKDGANKAQTVVIPAVPPAVPPTADSPAKIRITSVPPGAEVTRLSDNRLLGTTPLTDMRKPDGHTVDYRFHLAGHTDVQIPFHVESPGEFEVSATLASVEKRDQSGYRTNREGRSSAKSKAPSSTSTTTTALPAPKAKDSAPTDSSYQTLPPLGDRNPIKRLRH